MTQYICKWDDNKTLTLDGQTLLCHISTQWMKPRDLAVARKSLTLNRVLLGIIKIIVVNTPIKLKTSFILLMLTRG